MTAMDVIRMSFKKAKEDLDTVHFLMENQHPVQIYIVAFLCQQCAEKALKGFLQFNDIEPEKIHRLEILCEQCGKFDISFLQFMPKCSILTPYGVKTRYDDEIHLDEALTKQAEKYAQEIYDFCAEKVGLINSNITEHS